MALGDFLKQKYLDLIQPVQQSLSNVGNTVSSAVQSFNQPRTNVGSSQINLTKFKPILPTPQVNSNYYKGLQSLSNYQQGVGDYLQNRVVEPIKAAKMEFSKPGIVSKGLGALDLTQAGYNLSPVGIGTNITLGAGAGIANAKRTGQPLSKTVGQGITQNISPFQLATGIGDKPINVAGMNIAPALAFAGDVAVMNPQSTVNAFTKVGKLTSAFRKTPPPPPMHGEDVYYLDRAIDALRDRKLKGTSQRQTAVDIIDKLAEGYLPKDIIDKTKGDTYKLIKQLQKKVGSYGGASGTERIPGLGFAANNRKGMSTGTPILKGQADLENTLSPDIPQTPIKPTGLPESNPSLSSVDRMKLGRAGLSSQPPTGGGKPGSLSVNIPREPQTLNTGNLNLTTGQKAHIQDLQAGQVRQVLGDKEVLRIAKSAGFDNKTYTIDQTAQKIAEQLNTRRQVVELENQFTRMQKSGGAPEEMEALIRQIKSKAEETTSQGTDLARQLRARRIMADEISTPMQKIFKLLDSAGVNPDNYLKEATKVDFSDANQAVAFYRKYVPPKASEWIDALRYNSMLSSPNTHISNAFSNLVNTAVVAPIEKTVAGMVDFIGSAITRRPRQAFVSEAPAYMKGYFGSINKAVHLFADSLKGKTITGNLDFKQLPLAVEGSSARVLNKLSLPTRLLEASDQFFTALTQGGEEASLAVKKGRGVNIPDIPSAALSNARYRLFRSELKDPRQGKLLDAVDEFTGLIQKARSSKNPITSNIAKYTLPFVRTPMNILKQGIEYSPVGFATIPGAMNKQEQLAKAIMGSAAVAGSMALVQSGRTTWAEPTDEKKRAAFRAAGMQPYAVKIGDNWVSYTKLPPALSFPLAFVSAIHDAQENKTITDSDVDTILSSVAKFGNFFADQSYLKNIGDLISSVKGSPESVSRLISNYPQQLIPFRALFGWMARITDPYQRKVDSGGNFFEKQVQQLLTQLPFLSTYVPARTDQFGEPIINQNKEFNAFSPLRVTTEQPEQRQIYDLLRLKTKISRDNSAIKDSLERGVVPDTLSAQASEETTMEPGFAGSIVNLKDPQPQSISPAQQMIEDQKVSIIKDKLKYGGQITNAELALVIKPPQPIQLTGQEQLDKQITSEFNSVITSKQSMVKDLYSAGVIKKEEAEKYLKDFTAMKVSTKDQLTAEKQQIDAQYGLDSDMLKRSKDTQAWISTTEEYVKYLENYKSKLTDPTAQIRVQNRIEDLKTQLSKYTKQGGFTKGRSKKLKAPKVKAIKIKIPKIKAIKTKSIKLKKVKEYKLPKVKALKTARIKVKSKLT